MHGRAAWPAAPARAGAGAIGSRALRRPPPAAAHLEPAAARAPGTGRRRAIRLIPGRRPAQRGGAEPVQIALVLVLRLRLSELALDRLPLRIGRRRRPALLGLDEAGIARAHLAGEGAGRRGHWTGSAASASVSASSFSPMCIPNASMAPIVVAASPLPRYFKCVA